LQHHSEDDGDGDVNTEDVTAVDVHRHLASSTSIAELTDRDREARARARARVDDDDRGGLKSCNRNLALEMVRVTESGAVAAARWLGKGEKRAADAAAVEAMRDALQLVRFDGVVVVSEKEKDAAPMLRRGERVGTGDDPSVDIAIDPIEGTSLVAHGRNGGAISVIAIAERGAMYDPGEIFYFNKLAVGPRCVDVVDIRKSPTLNIHAIAKALKKPVGDVTCVVLDRPRHEGLIEEIRLAGARIKLISDGDVEAAVACCDPDSGVDALFGVGGTPEGVIAAAAMRCMGGAIQAELWTRNTADAAAIAKCGGDLGKVLHTKDLCGGSECFFAATGITDGSLLKGVPFTSKGPVSHSIVMRAPSGTVRELTTRHHAHAYEYFL
jgi:fructose-1,6-bisphosphatase II